MKALTAIAATAYAVGLWMFAPSAVWQKELETAKRNQQRRQTPKPVPQPEPVTPDDQELLPDTIWTEPDTSEVTPEEPQQPDYSQWTITQLRELAKQRKLNWRPLTNGKRKPLNKPQLIALLTA